MMSLTEGFRLKLTSDFAALGAGAFQVQKWPALQFGHGDRRKYERRRTSPASRARRCASCRTSRYVSIEEWARRPGALATRDRATQAEHRRVRRATRTTSTRTASTSRSGRFITDIDVAARRAASSSSARTSPTSSSPARIRSARRSASAARRSRWSGSREREGSILGQSKDAWAVVPWTAVRRARSGRCATTTSRSWRRRPTTRRRRMEEVVAKLRRIRGLAPYEENDFEIFSNDTSAQLFDNLARIVGAATFGVCALALLVGGIGVMNIMLVSVTERTREIGIRMALGARRRRILSQFLVESVALSALGGLVGVLLGGGARGRRAGDLASSGEHPGLGGGTLPRLRGRGGPPVRHLPRRAGVEARPRRGDADRIGRRGARGQVEARERGERAGPSPSSPSSPSGRSSTRRSTSRRAR